VEKKLVDELISSLKEVMSESVGNQLKRLRLISKNDSFINAFVLTQLVTDLLDENRDEKLKERLARFESG
jgi:hypothetical protein